LRNTLFADEEDADEDIFGENSLFRTKQIGFENDDLFFDKSPLPPSASANIFSKNIRPTPGLFPSEPPPVLGNTSQQNATPPTPDPSHRDSFGRLEKKSDDQGSAKLSDVENIFGENSLFRTKQIGLENDDLFFDKSPPVPSASANMFNKNIRPTPGLFPSEPPPVLHKTTPPTPDPSHRDSFGRLKKISNVPRFPQGSSQTSDVENDRFSNVLDPGLLIPTEKKHPNIIDDRPAGKLETTVKKSIFDDSDSDDDLFGSKQKSINSSGKEITSCFI